MRLVPTVRVLLALLVALLMPLEQARCACAAMRAPIAAEPAASAHACCEAKAPAAAAERQAPSHACSTSECGCVMTAAESAPATTLAAAAESLASSFAVLAITMQLSPEMVAAPAAPALDVGSPPSLDALGAHGMRAPPVIA